jgi:hypothetical protein
MSARGGIGGRPVGVAGHVKQAERVVRWVSHPTWFIDRHLQPKHKTSLLLSQRKVEKLETSARSANSA